MVENPSTRGFVVPQDSLSRCQRRSSKGPNECDKRIRIIGRRRGGMADPAIPIAVTAGFVLFFSSGIYRRGARVAVARETHPGDMLELEERRR